MDERVFSGNRKVDLMEKGESRFAVNIGNITKLIYHTPCGIGDCHFVDVYFASGEIQRVFDPDCVIWSDDSEDE